MRLPQILVSLKSKVVSADNVVDSLMIAKIQQWLDRHLKSTDLKY